MKTLDVIGVEPKVLEILEVNPALSYSFIADEVGVTRERVRQIAHRNGYPLRKGVLKSKICHICGGIFYRRNTTYCSPACGYKARSKKIVVNCHRCGKPVERPPSTMRSRTGKYYCSKICFEKRQIKTTL
jgi:hypothetical protein